jgi:hypothetical protein
MKVDEVKIESVVCPVCNMQVQYDSRSTDEYGALCSHINRLDMSIVLTEYGYKPKEIR